MDFLARRERSFSEPKQKLLLRFPEAAPSAVSESIRNRYLGYLCNVMPIGKRHFKGATMHMKQAFPRKT